MAALLYPPPPGGSDGKECTCNAGDLGLIPGSGRPLRGRHATHARTLAWRIPWTEEPGGLQSRGWQRVRHNWATKHSTALPHVYSLPRGQYPHQVGRLLQLMNLHWIITPSPQFTLGFSGDVVHSLDLEECIMTCIHHKSVLQSNFTALQTPLAPSAHHPIP